MCVCVYLLYYCFTSFRHSLVFYTDKHKNITFPQHLKGRKAKFSLLLLPFMLFFFSNSIIVMFSVPQIHKKWRLSPVYEGEGSKVFTLSTGGGVACQYVCTFLYCSFCFITILFFVFYFFILYIFSRILYIYLSCFPFTNILYFHFFQSHQFTNGLQTQNCHPFFVPLNKEKMAPFTCL